MSQDTVDTIGLSDQWVVGARVPTKGREGSV